MELPRSDPEERRKRQRQDIQLPLEITALDGVPVEPAPEVTLNISSGGGVCFRSQRTVAVGSRAEYVVTLSSGNEPVKIICAGRVTRCIPVESATDPGGNEIAFTMETYRFAGSH